MSDDPAEGRIWAQVVGYEGFYEVSDCGVVRSVDRCIARVDGLVQPRRGLVLKQTPSPTGHLQVDLYNGNGRSSRRMRRVHQLVAEAFIGPRPVGMEVCHSNGDPTDNRVENLRYDTKSGNMYDKVRHGRDLNASKTHCKHGHEFNVENTYLRPEGGRACKKCRKARNDKWMAKKGRQAA